MNGIDSAALDRWITTDPNEADNALWEEWVDSLPSLGMLWWPVSRISDLTRRELVELYDRGEWEEIGQWADECGLGLSYDRYQNSRYPEDDPDRAWKERFED